MENAACLPPSLRSLGSCSDHARERLIPGLDRHSSYQGGSNKYHWSITVIQSTLNGLSHATQAPALFNSSIANQRIASDWHSSLFAGGHAPKYAHISYPNRLLSGRGPAGFQLHENRVPQYICGAACSTSTRIVYSKLSGLANHYVLLSKGSRRIYCSRIVVLCSKEAFPDAIHNFALLLAESHPNEGLLVPRAGAASFQCPQQVQVAVPLRGAQNTKMPPPGCRRSPSWHQDEAQDMRYNCPPAPSRGGDGARRLLAEVGSAEGRKELVSAWRREPEGEASALPSLPRELEGLQQE
ncbi:uncharacterized protein EI97DRAFT_444121 [Westerdykella ornata]|uniref:Uncharacterized protein n=1 Tax=Westerdykella ornata TaxID=318751 RepID=A0A6A6JEE3_WESOR|nr:uncharacterized protein EI97DRAFT_444121 [Westerdykella ornata]KAF2274368.1 hypothetical protein EI97DRAFT_444121 [Westerdykella ornata]